MGALVTTAGRARGSPARSINGPNSRSSSSFSSCHRPKTKHVDRATLSFWSMMSATPAPMTEYHYASAFVAIP
jgi:hypothetical protein